MTKTRCKKANPNGKAKLGRLVECTCTGMECFIQIREFNVAATRVPGFFKIFRKKCHGFKKFVNIGYCIPFLFLEHESLFCAALLFCIDRDVRV